jgi:hypothetical protein
MQEGFNFRFGGSESIWNDLSQQNHIFSDKSIPIETFDALSWQMHLSKEEQWKQHHLLLARWKTSAVVNYDRRKKTKVRTK